MKDSHEPSGAREALREELGDGSCSCVAAGNYYYYRGVHSARAAGAKFTNRADLKFCSNCNG